MAGTEKHTIKSIDVTDESRPFVLGFLEFLMSDAVAVSEAITAE